MVLVAEAEIPDAGFLARILEVPEHFCQIASDVSNVVYGVSDHRFIFARIAPRVCIRIEAQLGIGLGRPLILRGIAFLRGVVFLAGLDVVRPKINRNQRV
jgi:hypothetical protein|tara:strand:- start:1701 stop:2000 length:300 start_codon:yes stop_codon:yes gene_type:complete